MPCTSVFQAISGWGWGDYICKFLYNKKVAIFFRLYHFYVSYIIKKLRSFSAYITFTFISHHSHPKQVLISSKSPS